MRVLITWGSKLGGTEGIARIIGETLKGEGFAVSLVPASEVRDVEAYDAAVVGGSLYANRWHRDARRLIARHLSALRRIPVWLFSSGPLDDSADREELAPAPQVAVLIERVGAVGHVTFGGRLADDVKGFPASAMAKTMRGDFRNPDRIRTWAKELARALPDARPATAIDHPAHSLSRLIRYGVIGWLFCSLVMVEATWVVPSGAILLLQAIAAPLIFIALSIRYFSARGARAPLPTALSFTAIVAILNAVIVTGPVTGSSEMLSNGAGTWLPLLLIFPAIWLTGLLMSAMPRSNKTNSAAPPTGANAHGRA